MNTTMNTIESKNNNVINGKVFIIPNPIYTPAELGWHDPAQWDKWVVSQKPYLEAHGLEPEEKMVQVWAFDNENRCGNFADHWREYQVDILGKEKKNWRCKPEAEGGFPTHLPVSIFKGKKEGDSIILHREDGLILNLELRQQGYRYQNHGKFEEVLDSLIKFEEKQSLKTV